MAFPDDWSHKRQISIDSGQKSGSPSGIVLTITEDSGVNDVNGPLDADGAAPCQSDGGDLRLSSDSAGTTQIPIDLVEITTDNNPASAVLEIKVNFDDLSSDSLYLWWGTSGTTSQDGVTDTYGRNAVYDTDHKLVLSLNEDPTDSAPQFTDRTGGGNDGTANGPTSSVAGQVGNAVDHDGSNDYIDCGNGTDVQITGNLTLSAWVKPDTLPSSPFMIAGRDDGTNRDYGFTFDTNGSLPTSFTTFVVIGNSVKFTASPDSYSTGSWVSVALVYDGSKVYCYVNGTSQGTPTSATGSVDNDAVNFQIGARNSGADRPFDGAIDEVRLYGKALSSDELTTLHNCESDNGAFWAVGAVESSASPTRRLTLMGVG